MLSAPVIHDGTIGASTSTCKPLENLGCQWDGSASSRAPTPKSCVPHWQDVLSEHDQEATRLMGKMCRDELMDKDKSGNVSHDELAKMLRQVGALDDTVDHHAKHDGEHKPRLTYDEFRRIMLSQKPRTRTGQCSIFLLCGALPTFYAASTRLPFIFVAVEAVDRAADMWQVTLVLGTYQTCRAVANLISSVGGKVSPLRDQFLAKTLCAFVGWILAGMMPQDNVYSLLLLGFVGLGEGIVELQSSVLQETQADAPSGIASSTKTTKRFRLQYASVCLGATVAFVAGGAIYNTMGFKPVCFMGACLNVVLILLSLLYIGIVRWSKQHKTLEAIERESAFRSVIYALCASTALQDPFSDQDILQVKTDPDVLIVSALKDLYQRVLARKSGGLFGEGAICEAMHIRQATEDPAAVKHKRMQHAGELASFTCSQGEVHEEKRASEAEFVAFLAPRVHILIHPETAVQPNEVPAYILVITITQAVVALCIGTFLSTALLYYTKVHELNPQTVGMLLGFGEGLAVTIMVAAQAFSSFREHISAGAASTIDVLMSRPLHIPMLVMTVGALTSLFTIPTFPVAVVSQLLFSAFNDTSVTLLNELIATSTPPEKFKKTQALGQTLRRLGNVLTAFAGPVLFNIASWLPFAVCGLTVFAWGLFVWQVLYWRALEVIPATTSEDLSFVSAFRPCVSKKWHDFEREFNIRSNCSSKV